MSDSPCRLMPFLFNGKKWGMLSSKNGNGTSSFLGVMGSCLSNMSKIFRPSADYLTCMGTAQQSRIANVKENNYYYIILL